MTTSKFLGSILIIVGTSIGGGMLALPVATAGGGFLYSALAFIICWILMTSGAYLILNILQPHPIGSNMISLARFYLGKPGELAVWLLFLTFLYSLLGAYISGGTDVVSNLLGQFNINLHPSLVSLIYTLSFSLIIYSGIKWVDYINRFLMFGKLGIYILLIVVITPFIQWQHFAAGKLTQLIPHLSILITSFGFASIVPSLRDYWHNDIKTLKRIIFWGSAIPLVCYLIWNFVIMGAISPTAPNNLLSLMNSDHAISGLGKGLSQTTHNQFILSLFDFFSSICMLTAFLNVSLGLFDFIADGFHLDKRGKQGKITLALTFIPPLSIVIIKPGIYLSALNYAGILCVLLLLILPIILHWKAKKSRPLDTKHNLSLVILFTAAIMSIILPKMMS